MKILSSWLREYIPGLTATDRQLADDLTLRGIAVEGVFDLGANGPLFEMDITTNRVDAMNHYGIAREAAIIYGLKLVPLSASLNELSSRAEAERSEAAVEGPAFPVNIEEPTLCGRFTARVLRNVKIQPSTGIVAERFRLLEQKPISNAVDATNYCTLAIGQPTHVFDLDKLVGGIIVRRARKGEKLRTLDGIERTLDPEDLVVADEKRPHGIAGVMGGWDSMITAETKNVLIEAAWFDTITVRLSSKRHLLHTDASHRFERGADFNAPPVASALVSRILLEAGGHQAGPLTDVLISEAEARTAKRPAIAFSLGEVKRILGPTEDPEGITAATAETILTGLGCALAKDGHGSSPHKPGPAPSLDPSRAVSIESAEMSTSDSQSYNVTLPSWRLDLEREIDLVEEIARVYGYNRFRNTLPAFAGAVVELPHAEKESSVRRTLLALGWTEAISSTFCAAADAALFAPQPNSAVPMGNPLSEEAGMLRPSLLPGMLSMLALNLNRDVEDAALFEMGTVFGGGPERVDERPALAIGAAGHALTESDVTFYDVKGTIEELLGEFSSRSFYFDNLQLPAWLHPGRSARATLDGATVAWFGQLHPAEAERRKLKQTVLVGEIYLDRLYKQKLRQPVVRELSRFQPVRRDFSLLFPNSTTWAAIEDKLRALDIPELRSFAPKEILRDAKSIPAGHFSLLLGVVFQSQERTLREEELQQFSRAIIAVMESIGGKLRV
ncbi:MAG: phenylalanine--tRNA ligase subunit beta [Silvibacterium sp.]|nr:phenylalanine--tRNA ligase subunit beta [Silvibacterium sp.]